MDNNLMEVYRSLTFSDSKDNDLKRENANINCDTAMGTMLKYGSEGAKKFYTDYILNEEFATAHKNGDIHIHDLDFYALTTTCCQIDITKLFKGGFSTGHGSIREPQSIRSYASLVCIAIQSNQNDQHGGQSIPNFDYVMSEGIKKSYKKNIDKFSKWFDDENRIKFLAWEETKEETLQAMESLIHNLNTMHSRAGAQIPFSSINYGTDTSKEGRLAIECILKATERGLGKGETPIFPIQIFRVKEGINYNKTDPNYDLFKLACKVSAKRLFPNFSFQDATFNLQYYKEGQQETEISYMGCRTRVIGNVYDINKEVTHGRGNLSFTTINLVKIALETNNILDFYNKLDYKMNLAIKQLLHRFEIQKKKKVRNFPFLMGQGNWIDSDKLNLDDEIGEVLKHGSLSVGFIGLAECLKVLLGVHHGESIEAQKIGLNIIKHMRDYLNEESNKHKLNFTLLGTPAEGTAGKFVKIDKEKYGIIEGVTDREYYTNSFHVPVYYKISAYNKIQIESPYHELTNAGHITYVELEGNPQQNIEAFEKIVRTMKESNIGYGAINHPIDKDTICGYTGVIKDICPNCGRSENNIPFERIRRITGYLVGTTDRFNNSKKAEENDRMKHTLLIKEEQKNGQNNVTSNIMG